MSKCKITSIGGQALIEGIMMRGPKKQALAVRTKDNNIDISFIEFKSIKEKYKFYFSKYCNSTIYGSWRDRR